MIEERVINAEATAGRDAQIPMRIHRLEKQLEEQAEVTRMLMERLLPVLRDTSDEQGGFATLKGEKAPVLAPLAASLESLSDKVEYTTSTLKAALDRLEV